MDQGEFKRVSEYERQKREAELTAKPKERMRFEDFRKKHKEQLEALTGTGQTYVSFSCLCSKTKIYNARILIILLFAPFIWNVFSIFDVYVLSQLTLQLSTPFTTRTLNFTHCCFLHE